MGFWWKGQWHTVTIPPLLERVPSPRRRTSHLDQWHSSCQGPNVLMSHTSQQFYFKVPPLSLPILHPHPCLFPPSFHPQPFDIHSPLTFRFVIPLTLTFLPVCLSICPVYPSYHASCWPFHLSPQRSVPAWRRATHPGGAAGLVRFMSREDGRLKGPPGISLCHQRLASMLPRKCRRRGCLAGLRRRNKRAEKICARTCPQTFQTHAHTHGSDLRHQKPTICASDQRMYGFLWVQWWFCVEVALWQLSQTDPSWSVNGVDNRPSRVGN